MHLLSLPNEILQLIPPYLEYADEINALSQTCQFLYTLINPCLYPDFAKNCDAGRIYHALQTGNYVSLQKLVQSGADIDELCSAAAISPISYAAEKGYLEIVRILLDKAELSSDMQTAYDDYCPLMLAALNGHFEVARLLLSRGATPDLPGLQSGRAPLSFTAERGSLAAVRFLVEKANCQLDSRDSDGRTPLSWAASGGNVDVVKYLLEAGADPQAKDDDEMTPLIRAAANGQEEVVSFLLDSGACTDLQNSLDAHSLAYIVDQKAEGMAAMLLGRIDVDLKIETSFGDDLELLIIVASACGHDYMLQQILEAGYYPLQVYNDELNISRAAANGHSKVVRMLLDSIIDRYPQRLDHAVTLTIYKASTNNHASLLEEILDREGKLTLGSCDSGALYFATPHEAVTRLLLQRGANPDKGGDRGMFVLEQAIHHGNPAVIRMLLDATGLSPVLKPPTRGPYQVQNLLDLAAESSTPEIIQLLLSRGVDFRPENVECQPAWVNAVCGLNTDVINLFLDAGFDVNYKATSGFNKDRPLVIIPAIKGTDEGCTAVKLLLDRGAQIDMMDESDRTALSWAAQQGNTTVVEELLARGADPLLKDVNNKTPLHWAALDGGRVVTRIILKTLEARGIRFDRLERFISNLEKDSRFDRELILKQLRQHRWRMMYPCP